MSRTISVGKRVQIVGLSHPWKGERGTIVAPFVGHPSLDWTVELDQGDYPGHQSAVGSHEIRPLEEEKA